jgi:superfamily II DNA helicase RecQ
VTVLCCCVPQMGIDKPNIRRIIHYVS